MAAAPAAPAQPALPAEASGAGVATPALPQRPWGTYGFRHTMVGEAQRRGFQLYRHKEAGVPWLYHAPSGVFINYEDPRSLALKGEYVRQSDLGGIMIWEIGSDTTGVLLQSVWKAMR